MRALLPVLLLLILLILFCGALLAPFLAPYPPNQQFREWAYLPPTRLHLGGPLLFRPFIYGYESDGPLRYRQNAEVLPVRFFVRGRAYVWMGMVWETRLFGIEDENRGVFLLGTDSLGRDLFSRILHGARYSLTIALVAILLTMLAGTLLGALSGYLGGWTDILLMRTADAFLALPGLFLILGLRALFPLEVSAERFFWLIVLIFVLVGWASITRVIRGQVISLKSRTFVLAARAYGASHARILLRHILPFTLNTLVVQATVLMPGFILGEITLSFLGVGIQEPEPSWGNLLSAAVSLHVFTDHQWLLWPAAFIFIAVFSLNLLGDELRS